MDALVCLRSRVQGARAGGYPHRLVCERVGDRHVDGAHMRVGAHPHIPHPTPPAPSHQPTHPTTPTRQPTTHQPPRHNHHPRTHTHVHQQVGVGVGRQPWERGCGWVATGVRVRAAGCGWVCVCGWLVRADGHGLPGVDRLAHMARHGWMGRRAPHACGHTRAVARMRPSTCGHTHAQTIRVRPGVCYQI